MFDEFDYIDFSYDLFSTTETAYTGDPIDASFDHLVIQNYFIIGLLILLIFITSKKKVVPWI